MNARTSARFSRLPIWALIWALTVFGLAACDSGAPSTVTTVRDSAGVAIAEIPASAPVEEWTVSEAVLTLGGMDERPDYELYNVTHALRLDDGRVVVANRGTRELRFYAADGTHLRTVGRQGGGPGEYEDMWGLVRLPGDSLGVWDWTAKRLTVYDDRGELGRTVNPPGLDALGPRLVGAFADGSFAVTVGFDIMALFAGGGGEVETPFHLLRIAPDGAVLDSLGPYPGEQRFVRRGARTLSFHRVIYGRTEYALVAGDAVYTADDRTGEVRIYDAENRLRRVVRRHHVPQPVTDADVQLHRETWLANVSEAQREAEAENLAATPTARTLPAFTNLFVDRLGRIWLREFTREPDGPRDWTVLAADGGSTATLQLPPRFTPLDAGEDYLLGLARDDLDVERITLHRLSTGRTP
jgi:hypothetical protein